MKNQFSFLRILSCITITFVVLSACTKIEHNLLDPLGEEPLQSEEDEHGNVFKPSLLAEWEVGRIEAMAWSPDNRTVVVNYRLYGDESNNYIQAFDVLSLSKKWLAKNSLAMDLIFTSDKQYVLETNVFAPILYWRSAETGNVMRQDKYDDCLEGGQFIIANSKGNSILVADTNDLSGLNRSNTVDIRQWDFVSNKCKNLLSYQGGFDIFDLNSSGILLAFGGTRPDGSVVIWDLRKQGEVCKTKEVDYGHFLPDENTLVVSREEKIVFIDASTCQDLRELSTTTIGTYLAFSPDGLWMAIANDAIELIETSTGKALAKIPFPNNASLYDSKLFSGGIEFSPDGRFLLLAFSKQVESGVLQLWQVKP